jgi:hypothetical protein
MKVGLSNLMIRKIMARQLNQSIVEILTLKEANYLQNGKFLNLLVLIYN